MIVRVSLQRVQLPLRSALRTARGEIHERVGVVLALEHRSGERGFGEAFPLAGWPGGTLAQIEAELAAAATKLLGMSATEALAAPLSADPLTCAALDTALADLAAREAGVPLATWLADAGEAPRTAVAVNALIASESPKDVAAAAVTAAARGMRAFKLKIGAAPLERDLARARALRAAIGDTAALRLDANGAWSEREAERALTALECLAPEYVEEPVASLEACAQLRAHTQVPIAVDESASDSASLERALLLRAADVLVLKLPLLGGPRAARAAALHARDAGVDVVISSFLDSALGIAAALHCAASLPATERAHGLATGALLADDVAELMPSGGMLALPEGAGLGIAPSDAALARVACATRWERRA